MALVAYKACGNAGGWLLRGAAVVGAICSGLAMLLFTMLGNDGISLGVFRPTVEGVIAARTGVERVSVGDIMVLRDSNEDTPFRVSVTNIKLVQSGGTDLFVPELSLRLDGESLFRGQAMPRFAEVTGAEISVERGDGGVSMGGKSGAGDVLDIGALIGQVREAGFEGAILRDLKIRYRNVVTGASFDVDNGTASIVSEGNVYAFGLSVPYVRDGDDGKLTADLRSEPATDKIVATLTVQNVPAEVILPLFLGAKGGVELDAPVSGTLTAEGGYASGFETMGMALYVGAGSLSLGEQVMPLEQIIFDGVFNPQKAELDLARLEFDISGNKAKAVGVFGIEIENGRVDAVQFDVAAEGLVLDPGGLFEEPLSLATAKARGLFDFIHRTLSFDHLEADYFGAMVSGTGRYEIPSTDGESPGLFGDVIIEGILSPSEVLRGWPVGLGQSARDWVKSNLPDGALSNVKYTMAIPRGQISGGEKINDENLDLTFDARNATVIYVPGMRPITGLSARGRVRGNSFSLTAKQGKIGNVSVPRGSVTMGQFVPKGADAVFSATTTGRVPDLFAVLDEKPLGLITGADLSPSQFDGDGEFTIKVVRPLLEFVPIKDYHFSGSGTFSNLEMKDLLPGISLDGGAGEVRLTKNNLHISGNADAEGVPTAFKFTRRLGGVGAMDVHATTTIDSRVADTLGLPFRRFVHGSVDLAVSVQGHSGSFQRATVAGDFTQTSFTGEDQDTIKAVGEPGDLIIELDLMSPDRIYNIESMRLMTGGLNIEGNAKLDENLGLIDLDIPRFFIDNYADVSIRIRREAADLVVKVEGEYAYLGSFVSDLLSGGSTSDLPGSITFDMQLNSADMNGDVSFSKLRVFGDHTGNGINNLSANGVFSDGGNVKLEVESASSGLGRDIRLETDQFGKVLEGVFAINSVIGGEALIVATALDNGPVAGSFTASGLTVQGAPTVARLLSIGSLGGLENVLNGEGIDFDLLQGDLQIDEGVLRFVDTRLTGSALGLSANGDVDLQGGAIKLHGAIAPAYQVNSILGAIPRVGDILVSREGEGIFAFAYRVEGPLSEPRVLVNSLTALTPGIFRRLFEPVIRHRPSTEEILNTANEAARMNEAREYLSTPELLREHEGLQKQQPTNVPAPR